MTLPTLHYLERCPDGGAVQAVLAGERDEAHVQAAIDAIVASGAIESALAEARKHARESVCALASASENDTAGMVRALARCAVERTRRDDQVRRCRNSYVLCATACHSISTVSACPELRSTISSLSSEPIRSNTY